MKTPLSIAVVIPSYRRSERLERITQLWRTQGADQIIVVLDGLHPEASQVVAKLEQHGVHVLELPENRGLALARIAGLAMVSADVTIMADDDVAPEPGNVDAHREHHENHPDAPVLVGYMPVKYDPASASLPTKIYAAEYERACENWEREPESVIDCLWNGNVSIRTDVYRNAEALRPSIRLAYNEDLDLGLRIKELGYRAVFSRSAAATHEHVRDIPGFINESIARGSSIAILEERWGSLPPQLEDLISFRVEKFWVDAPVMLLSRLPQHFAAAALVRLCRWMAKLPGPAGQTTLRLSRRVLAQHSYRLARGQ